MEEREIWIGRNKKPKKTSQRWKVSSDRTAEVDNFGKGWQRPDGGILSLKKENKDDREERGEKTQTSSEAVKSQPPSKLNLTNCGEWLCATK